jgi:APA family basic amino acid/polyamine antiporter
MTQLGRITWIAFGIWVAAGLLMYFGYSRRRSNLAGDVATTVDR